MKASSAIHASKTQFLGSVGTAWISRICRICRIMICHLVTWPINTIQTMPSADIIPPMTKGGNKNYLIYLDMINDKY